VIVSLLSYIYTRFRELPLLKSVLASMRPAVVALIAAAGMNMFFQLAFGGKNFSVPPQVNWCSAALFFLAFAALRRFKWNPILVMAACGAAMLLLGLTGVVS